MERALQWVVVLTVCASLIITDGRSNSKLLAAKNNERADRKLANIDQSGVISIDCGVNEDYIDKITNTEYQADTKFVKYGQSYNVSTTYTYDFVDQIKNQLNTLRSFPNGMRNCYTLKPKQGTNKKYLIRAYFAYGNYDNKNKVPIFDLHLGVNLWTTIELNGTHSVFRTEVIHTTPTGTIDVCLVNTNQGVPFISLLELWPVESSIYQSTFTSLPLKLMTRANLGMPQSESLFIRYTDDIYGRSWYNVAGTNEEIHNSSPIKTSVDIDLDGLTDPYKLPRGVLSSGCKALNLSNSLDIIHDYNTSDEYIVYLHFFDFEDREVNQERKMEITFKGDDAFTQRINPLTYWQPWSIFQPTNQVEAVNHISIKSTSDTDLPAMLNAYEIYKALPQPNSATQQEDVDAIQDIKHQYMISKINWQGDPCGPIGFTWENLTCSRDDIPRIISLNLSSSNLAGNIGVSFSGLTNLEILDLSNNELEGEVPSFFADLAKLKILNLRGNKLMGPIPEALKVKKSNNSLQLSLDGNHGLCETSSCESKSNSQNQKKSVARLATSIVLSVCVLITVLIVSMVWWLKRKNGRGMYTYCFDKKKETLVLPIYTGKQAP